MKEVHNIYELQSRLIPNNNFQTFRTVRDSLSRSKNLSPYATLLRAPLETKILTWCIGIGISKESDDYLHRG